jgi:3-mercaptopyruvate sulfurtransferase SseA
MPLISIAVGALLVVAAVWITMDRPVNQAADQPTQTTTAPPQATGPYPEVPRISPTEAQAGMESRNALMVDVRTERDFHTARIAEALHIPAADIATRYQELPKDRPIYLYCT